MLKNMAMGLGFGGLLKKAKNIVSNRLNDKAARLMSGDKSVLPEPKFSKNTDNIVPLPSASKVDDVIDLTPGSKGGWNKTLNGELKPNSKYKVGDYLYETDDLGRVHKVSGNLELGKLGRNNYQQGKSVKIKDGIIGEDQGGHLIGHQFKGAGEQINYVPQKGTLNNGAWKKMEQDWANALKEIPPKKVEVEITPIYEGASKRPTDFDVFYKIGDQEFIEFFPNN